jgi:hypothetical protein
MNAGSILNPLKVERVDLILCYLTKFLNFLKHIDMPFNAEVAEVAEHAKNRRGKFLFMQFMFE